MLFGTSTGQLVVMTSAGGTIITELSLNEGYTVTSLKWNCEKFRLVEDDNQSTDSDDKSSTGASCV